MKIAYVISMILLLTVVYIYTKLVLEKRHKYSFIDKLQKDPNISVEIDGRVCHNNVKMLVNLCDITNCKTYCEIGVHNGTSMSYAASSKNVQKCIGIDLFEDTHGHYMKDNLSLKKSLQNINNNKTKNGNPHCSIKLIRGNSNDENVIQNLINELQGRHIDVLFIDGDHSYEGVKRDYYNYKKFVSGYIVFDDYNEKWPGVKKFVDEIIEYGDVESIGLFFGNEYVIKTKNV